MSTKIQSLMCRIEEEVLHFLHVSTYVDCQVEHQEAIPIDNNRKAVSAILVQLKCETRWNCSCL